MSFFRNFHLLSISSKSVILLSILGLLPFFFGLIDIIVNKDNLFFKINIPKYYGSIILTFLGAAYWGIVLHNSNKSSISEKVKTYITCWSIVPSLMGGVVLIVSHEISIIILALGFIFVQFIDEFIIKYFNFPIWYLLLRRILTVIVAFILIFSYFLIKKIL